MGDQAITLSDEHRFATPKSKPLLEVLFREHHERIFLAAYRVTGSVQDAEDVLQSIFLRLLKRTQKQHSGPVGIPTGIPVGIPVESPVSEESLSYLCRAAINASLDILRKRRRVKMSDVDDNRNEADPNAPPADIDVSRAEQRRHLRQALMRLNARAAEMFALRYFEDFSNHEIAEMLGTSSSTVAVTLHRTRDRLQELLREFEGESS